MITEERFWALLVESNPFPEADSHEVDAFDITAHLTALDERSSQTDRKALHRQPTTKEVRRSKAAVKWPAAALVVAVAGVAILLTSRAPSVVQTMDSPLEVATMFIDAQNRHDGATMTSLTAADAELTGLLVEDPADFDLLADWERAVGWEVQVEECIDLDPVADGSARVFCTFDAESKWNRALGFGPIRDSSIRFVINEGKIHNISHNLGSGIADIQNEFQLWLNNAHPGAAVGMFREEDRRNPDFGIPRPLLTPETIRLFEQYTDEYVAYLTTTPES